MLKRHFSQRRKRGMSWLNELLALLILVACGLGFYFWRRHKSEGEPKASIRLHEKYARLWAVLNMATANYEKEQLPHAIRQEFLSGKYSESILDSLEETYGKAEGCPWLSLPKEWRGKSAQGIRAWMISNNLPYDDKLPALHQLELLLERRVQEKAKAILNKTIKRQ